jgi:hypothetical protein
VTFGSTWSGPVSARLNAAHDPVVVSEVEAEELTELIGMGDGVAIDDPGLDATPQHPAGFCRPLPSSG